MNYWNAPSDLDWYWYAGIMDPEAEDDEESWNDWLDEEIEPITMDDLPPPRSEI